MMCNATKWSCTMRDPMPTQPDLVLRARGGDHEAFTALAAGALSRLHRTARLILRDDERASDAVQEALTSAWVDIRGLRDPERFDAWLHRLLVRACYREARRHRSRSAMEIHVEPLTLAGTVTPGPDLGVRDELERGFRKLTPEHRAVLVVHHYLGLSDTEAADALGIPPGTFKSRLSRATAALRAELESQERAPRLARESIT